MKKFFAIGAIALGGIFLSNCTPAQIQAATQYSAAKGLQSDNPDVPMQCDTWLTPDEGGESVYQFSTSPEQAFEVELLNPSHWYVCYLLGEAAQAG